MFPNKFNSMIPPPPNSSKSRNDSLTSTISTYRNRPSSGLKDLKASFDAFSTIGKTVNKPEVRNALSSLAQNPLAQKVFSTAMDDSRKTLNQQQQQNSRTASQNQSAIKSNPLDNFNDILKSIPDKPLPAPPGEFFYKMLTKQDPFNFPPQLPSPNASEPKIIDLDNGSSSNFGWNQQNSSLPLSPSSRPSGTAFNSMRIAPSRPPPPKLLFSNDQSTISSSSLLDPDINFLPFPTNEPNAVARYSYYPNNSEQLALEHGDVLLLRREVDSEWIYATSTRTGETGLAPLSYLQIQVPLVPTGSAGYFSQTTWNSTSCGPFPVRVDAKYDYDSGVEGDLKFKAGDPIVVFSRANNEWLHGELDGKRGIIPLNYVQGNVDDLYALPVLGGVAEIQWSVNSFRIAAYDYPGQAPEDLCFTRGALIQVLQEKGNGWILGCLVENRGVGQTIGLVPLTYLR